MVSHQYPNPGTESTPELSHQRKQQSISTQNFSPNDSRGWHPTEPHCALIRKSAQSPEISVSLVVTARRSRYTLPPWLAVDFRPDLVRVAVLTAEPSDGTDALNWRICWPQNPMSLSSGFRDVSRCSHLTSERGSSILSTMTMVMMMIPRSLFYRVSTR